MNATIGLLAYGLRPSPLAEVPTYLLASGAYSSLSWDLQMAAAHADCHISAFCRNPLHPGPCKGWKHHLGLVSPGALHALERSRHDKLEARRVAKVQALKNAGHPIPKKLLTPIVYDPAKNKHIGPNAGPPVTPGSPNLTPDVAKKAVAAIPTAADLRKKVDTRRKSAALVAESKAVKASDFAARLRAFTGGKHYSDAEKATLAKQLQDLHANDPQGHLKFLADGYAAKVAKKANDRLPAKLTPAENAQLHQEITDNLTGNGKPTPLLDRIEHGVSQTGPATGNAPAAPHANTPAVSAPAKAAPSAPSARVSPSPAAPLPAGTPAHVQNAVAVAHRSGPRSAVAKTQVDAYGKLSKDDFNALPAATQKRITDDLSAAHAKFLDPKKQKAVQDIKDRLTGSAPAGKPAAPSTPTPSAAPNVPPVPTPTAAPATPAPAAAGKHSAVSALDAVRNEKDPAKVAGALTQLRYKANDPASLKAFTDLTNEIAADKNRPLWLRAQAATANPDTRVVGGDLNAAVHTAGRMPSTNGRLYTSSFDLETLLAPSNKELATLPQVLQDAIHERRTEALRDTFNVNHNATLQARESALVAVFGDPQGKNTLDRYNSLTPQGRAVVDAGLDRHIRDKSSGQQGLDPSRGSAWQSVRDKVDGRTYSHEEQQAIKAAQNTYATSADRIRSFQDLSKAQFDGLPDAHKTAISMPLITFAGPRNPDPVTRRAAMHELAKFGGMLPTYQLDRHRNAALAAGIDKDFLAAPDRAALYHRLVGADWTTLKPSDKTAILRDMQTIADDQASGLSLGDRHDLQFATDGVTGDLQKYTSEQRKAIATSDPGVRGMSTVNRLGAYAALDHSTFRALPKAYQDAIRQDMTALQVAHPDAHDAVMVKLDPSWQPPNNVKPTNVSGANVDPHLKAAVDTLYGFHPKSHTAAHQLSAYGALKKHQFDQLNTDEKSQLLGDLSFIATTSKGANKDKAERLINNFTPPGTPYGQPNVQAVIPPNNAVSGQVRDPNPAGKTGLLVQAKDKGLSGDGWTTTSSGKRVWGKYGASGVLLRHVGPDGKERFLMVQRGPAISDPGKWQFPGGAIDSKETAYTGGTREVIEELGFKDGSLDNAAVHGHHEAGVPGSTWKYTSIAATVPHQLVPDLSDPHARAETSDAKWMTRDEIAQLDTSGKLLAPLAGGKLEQNVLSLFPASAHSASRPAPRSTRLARLRGTPSISMAPAKPHKTSRAKDLIPHTQAERDLSTQLKGMRKQYAGKTADDRLAAIGELQGFNDTPTVAPKSEIDRLLATGDYIEAWRGVSSGGNKSAAKINEEMRSGPAYYGTGIFGNGYYLATDRSVAAQYSDHTKNSVVRILIPKDAVTIDHAKALDGAKVSYSSKPYRYASRWTTGQGSLHDEGRWAAAKGHDGIVITQHARSPGGGATHVARSGKPAYNWLNRSVLIIQEADK